MGKINIGKQVLIREVERILGEPDIRLSDNFIELGGTSFLALQLASVLQEKEGIAIDVAELLAYSLDHVSITFTGNTLEYTE